MKQHHLADTIELIVQGWNTNCQSQGIDKTFVVSIGTRMKKVKVADKDNKIQEGSVAIMELTLVENSNKINRLLYRTDTPTVFSAGGKVQNQHHLEQLNDHKCKTQLYNSFLYECIGTFCVAASKSFSDKSLAEYDVDLDRIKGDEEFTGVWIEVDKADETDWFKVGDRFEVFTKTPTHNWGVYSYRQDFKNGIGQIPMTKAKVVKDNTTKKENPLDELGKIHKEINSTLGSIENKIEKSKATKKAPVKRIKESK